MEILKEMRDNCDTGVGFRSGDQRAGLNGRESERGNRYSSLEVHTITISDVIIKMS